jgi:hypothetical protein
MLENNPCKIKEDTNMTNKMLAKGPMRIQAETRAKAARPTIQRQKKDGNWGKPRAYEMYGSETAETVVERLNALNPGSLYRLAQ